MYNNLQQIYIQIDGNLQKKEARDRQNDGQPDSGIPCKLCCVWHKTNKDANYMYQLHQRVFEVLKKMSMQLLMISIERIKLMT